MFIKNYFRFRVEEKMDQPELYSTSNDLQKSGTVQVLENYVRLMRWKKSGREKILDVGCGSGDVTMDILLPFLPKDFDKLVGCDSSEEMVNYANKKYSSSRVDFVKLDISSEKIPDDLEEEFDHIFSFYCMHWIQDQL